MLSDSMLDLGKGTNRKMHESESACFRLGHFARSKIESESFFLIQCYKITIQFFLERFSQYLTKSKNLLLIVFSNLARKGLGFFLS